MDNLSILLYTDWFH